MACAVLNATPVAAQVTYETRAFIGDAAPGTGPSVVFSGFGNPSINNNGNITFVGFVTGAGVTSANNTGIWSQIDGPLQLTVREGGPAPGAEQGMLFRDFSDPVSNNSGDIAFRGFLGNLGSPDNGIWMQSGGVINTIAQFQGSTTELEPDLLFGALFFRPVVNVSGDIAFYSSLTGTGVNATNAEGIWLKSGGVLNLIARAGDNAAGTEPGVVFSRLFEPVLNIAGNVVFRAELAGMGVDFGNDSGIWLDAGGSSTLVVREGMQAVENDPGVVFSNILRPVINDAGDLAFLGSVQGPGVDNTNGAGIWATSGGELGLVVRAGDDAPSTEQGVIFDLFGGPVFNVAGEVAFVATLDGTNSSSNTGIWVKSSKETRLIARTGDHAPGTNPDVVFNGFDDPILNRAGTTAFLATLDGASVDPTNNEGIWATDSDGLLKLIAREGDLFNISNDPFAEDLRTISFVSLITNSDEENGQRTSLNNTGQLAFRLGFTDGQGGIFVANLGLPRSPADFDLDGDVDDADFGLAFAAFTGPGNGPTSNPLADLDSDGDVDDADFGLAFAAFTGPGSVSNVPEPGALAMLVGLGLLTARRRRVA